MRPASDSMAVVDHHGSVHGREKLRVFDASIMLIIPRGNTNTSIIMLAEKIAEPILT